MTSTIEIARDALLLTLILVLVYVLYKRLLVFMNKKSENGRYVEIVRFEQTNTSGIELDVSVPDLTELAVSIEDDKGTIVRQVVTHSFDEGLHTLNIPLTELTTGKYSLKLQSPNSQQTRFFTVL